MKPNSSMPHKPLTSAGSVVLFALGLCAIAVLARAPRAHAEEPKLAATTSYLESAVHDLLGPSAPVLRLAEPGTCPGHFDIRPSQATELRRCQALLRFDFQRSLDSMLDGTSNRSPIIAVSIRRGLCLPESYLSACRQVAEGLIARHWLARAEAEARLAAIGARLQSLSQLAINEVAGAGLNAQPVLTSGHQKDFCEWLGLRVAGTFSAADTAGLKQIDQAIKAGRTAQVRLVIANLPEGRQAADALAERLKAKVVVFGNFPALENGRVSFDDLVRTNVGLLVKACKP